MAKQLEDTVTPDMLDQVKRRGRPATGKAMTPAERKRAQRERDSKAVWEPARNRGKKEPEEMTTSALLEGLRECVKGGWGGIAQVLADELVRRAREGVTVTETTGHNVR